jgi:outer membrane protein assembly factor BamB
MLLTCERCGAPLDIPPGGAVRCAFCGATTRAAAAPYPRAQPSNQRFAKRAGIASALVGLIVAFAVVGGVAANILSKPSATAVPAPPATSEAAEAAPVPPTVIWSTLAPGCLIDANGDGVSDVVGVTSTIGGTTDQGMVVDGKTGQVLFTSPAVAHAGQLGCLGAQGFFLVEGNFQIDFFSAHSPWSQTQVMARDKVQQYGVGAGCVQLRTQDGTTQGLQLPGGVATTCPSGLLRPYSDSSPGLLPLNASSTELSFGARKYNLAKRAAGTPILSLRVTEDGRPVWAKDLPYASCTFASGLAVAPGKIMLWVAHPSERDKGLIVGLDERTGDQLYELPVSDHVSEDVALFEYNGKYVVAVSGAALRAYDPATGAEVWRIGL